MAAGDSASPYSAPSAAAPGAPPPPPAPPAVNSAGTSFWSARCTVAYHDCVTLRAQTPDTLSPTARQLSSTLYTTRSSLRFLMSPNDL
ncbi:hypothetical protein MSG28_002995 [Choristoneura fumiferana]|uniref:Uncharacterized protein n=1 Tax=Choristoneura fumiferana TaxID=7141 RepID=A0ACC0JK63_CHOFU|nr:hypothetical protein MSG28_002995 [Choristoneura fumiferana]